MIDHSDRRRTAGHEAGHGHLVDRVHRVGGAVVATGLLVFGVLGLLDMPQFFARRGNQVMGMGSNGALAVLSSVVAVGLFAAAMRGGRASSTTCMALGVLFLTSGFLHLAILDTAANLLAFRLPNVFFSFAVGVVLLALGAYGRVSGGLAPDSPYARATGTTPRPGAVPAADLVDAEQAIACGRGTPSQHRRLRASRVERAGEHYGRAWRAFAATHTEAEVHRLRADSVAESVTGTPAAPPASPTTDPRD